MRTILVRYKTSSPAHADTNEKLIHGVFDALRARGASGLRYQTFRGADGVTFFHFATHEGEASLLTGLPEFKEFQRELASRCAEPPVATDLSPVDSYGVGS